MSKIKIRLTMLILSLITLMSLMAVTIRSEAQKIENVSENYKEKLIRFHVIANSDSNEDQALKLKVRDGIIEYLQPKLVKSKGIAESEAIIKNEYDKLKEIGENIVLQNGYNYEVKVGIELSKFPAKQYSNIVLPAGEYKALKIIIGEGKGKNWWCVMFPPLCFVNEDNGVIDEETDKKLREVLSKEEYELIAQKDKKQSSKVKVKFKIVEILEQILL